jgi:methanol metabolism-related c-type cytochrome
MSFSTTTLSLACGTVVALALLTGSAAAQSGGAGDVDWEKQPYIIKDGKVDYGTYNGYRRYHSYCHTCHGPDGMGSSYAPALKDSLKALSYSDFLDVVVNGRKNLAAGKESVMPPFGEVQDVMLYIDHIYAYLKARSDDKIGRGRPERIDPEQDPVFKEWKANQ